METYVGLFDSNKANHEFMLRLGYENEYIPNESQGIEDGLLFKVGFRGKY